MPLKPSKTKKTGKDVEEFLNAADNAGKKDDKDIIMRSYRFTKGEWLALKHLASDLTFQTGKKVNMEMILREGLAMVFEKYGVKVTEHSSNSE